MKEKIKKNWKNIVGSLVFLTLAVVMLTGISYILRPTDRAMNRSVFTGFYAEEENSLDVVTLGSSAIYRFFNNPYLWEEFGITSYNMATSTQQVNVADNLMKEVLKTQKPKVFVVETRQFVKVREEEDLEDVYYRRVTDNLNYSLDRIRLINEVETDWEKRFQLYFDIISYHGEWENVGFQRLGNFDNKSVQKLKGWESLVYVKEIKKPNIDSDIDPKPIEPELEEELIKLMDFAKENEIEILFVATPWRISKDRQAKNIYLGNVIRENGFEFLDCNQYMDEIGVDFSTDYYDPSHMNVWGSEKVTKFIGQYLKDNYDLDVEHTEETIRSWDEVVNEYKIQIEEKIEAQKQKKLKQELEESLSEEEEA